MQKQYNRVKAISVFEIDSIIYLAHAFSSRIIEESKCYDFWQMYYCAKGTIHIKSNDKLIEIPEHHAMLLDPCGDLRTALRAPAGEESEFFVISFECRSQTLYTFNRKAILLYGSEPALLEELCTVGRKILEPVKSDSSTQGLCEKSDSNPAVLQYVKISLEQFLIKLYCRLNHIESLQDEAAKANRTNYEKGIAAQAEQFMSEHLGQKLTIRDIAANLKVNATTLRMTYKKETGKSLMRGFADMKMTEAKRLICDTSLNFTQIGERLGFLSLYHFSRFFKEREGITLSDYSRFVQKIRK